jgi:hypothetical protein
MPLERSVARATERLKYSCTVEAACCEIHAEKFPLSSTSVDCEFNYLEDGGRIIKITQ